MKKVLALITLALFALTAPAFAAKYTMKISHAAPASKEADDHMAALFMKAYIEQGSGGQIEVQIFPANQLGSFSEVMQQLQGNAVEVASVSSGGYVNFAPELQLLDLPYLIKNDAIAEKFMEGKFIPRMRQHILSKRDNTLLVAAANSGGWRSFLTTKKQIKTPADMAGVKVRTINSPLQQELVKSMGGIPIAVPWAEVYTSLATGLAEGTKNNIYDIMVNKFDEFLNYAVIDRHAYLFGFHFISKKWLESLPEDLQKVVIGGIQEAAKVQIQFLKRLDMEYLDKFAANGGTVYTPNAEDRKKFQEAAKPLIDWYVGKYGQEWLDYYLDCLKEAEVEADKEMSLPQG